MEIWAIIVIVVLFIAIVALGIFFAITTKNNYDLSAQQRLYPFAAVIDPQNPNTVVPLTYTTPTGETGNQITCPAGTKINIVGAFFDIVDPYGMCTPNPNSLVSATCGGPGSVVCSATKPCTAPGMDCEPSQNPNDPNSYCVAAPCNSSTVLPASTSTTSWICNSNPALPLTAAQKAQGYTGRITPVEICSNLNNNFQNTTCANGANNCAPRDASAYLAKACNGQQTCNATITSDFFGPFPCGGGTFQNPGNVPNACSGTQTASSGYCSLPYAPGTDTSFTPTNGGSTAATTFSQGYMVHGLYTCVPN